MPGLASNTLIPVNHMPRGKKNQTKAQSEEPVANKQVNFRASPELYQRLERAAEGLGLDVSNLVRMVLMEHLPDYERRAGQTDCGGKQS